MTDENAARLLDRLDRLIGACERIAESLEEINTTFLGICNFETEDDGVLKVWKEGESE